MNCIVFACVLLLSATTLCHAACSIYENGLTQQDKDIVVNKHNELRRLISDGAVPGQPKGTDLKEIRYDETLALTAQELANSCKFAHTKVSDGRWHAVGQNLYISMSTAEGKGADWSKAIQNWFDEHKDYKYGGEINSQNGHYTQVVWANTGYIGCGYAYFEADDYFKYKKLYACNYGPAGNYVDQLPYKT